MLSFVIPPSLTIGHALDLWLLALSRQLPALSFRQPRPKTFVSDSGCPTACDTFHSNSPLHDMTILDANNTVFQFFREKGDVLDLEENFADLVPISIDAET